MGNYDKTKVNGSYSNGEVGNLLDDYLKNMGRYDLIDRDKEVELARRIKEGDIEARDELVTANLRFIVKVAAGYRNRGVPFEDLINEGNRGMIVAAYRFDETKGVKFISYAVWWARQAILQALHEEQPFGVKVPYNLTQSILKANRVAGGLEKKLGRKPSDRDVAEALGMEEDKYSEFRSMYGSLGTPVSLDDSVGDESTRGDLFHTGEDVEEEISSKIDGDGLRRDISRALSTLTEREARVIELYFGLDGNGTRILEEIGTEFSLTRERIRQIKEKALLKLRKSPRKHLLQPYL